KGIDLALLKKATLQSREARLAILDKMHAVIGKPREEISNYAPRIITLHINQQKIGDLIGPGGKNIRRIIEDTGCTIDIEDDGAVLIASTDSEGAKRAQAIITGMMEEAVVGKTYHGKVTRVMNFGAFCEFLPGKEGLVHISELTQEYIKEINKAVKVGDEFKVKVIEIDEKNRVNLSKKQAE
ncbi:MAG: S1 RNA-binding domain-containing protein, partial [Candidatus Omnitrophota bacterium]